MDNVKLDATGKKCPMPVLLTKKELKRMQKGQLLELHADYKGTLKDIPSLLNKSGDELIETKEEGSTITFIIKKI